MGTSCYLRYPQQELEAVMKLSEILDEADYPIAYILIRDRLKKGEQIRFHSEGTRGFIKSIEPETDGFKMHYDETTADWTIRSYLKDEYTHVRLAELTDATLTKIEDGWHLELPLYDGGAAARAQKTFKAKNRKNQS
jgi:hypothetical protein